MVEKQRRGPSGRLKTRSLVAAELLELRSLLSGDPALLGMPDSEGYMPGELLVQFRLKVSEEDQLKARETVQGTLLRTIHTTAMQREGTGVLERIRLGEGISVEKAIGILKDNPQIVVAEPNYILRPTFVSNDALYADGSLWGMYSSDSPSARGPAGTTNTFGSAAECAWDHGFTGSRNVAVGILDTGIQITHPDLVNNIWVNPDEIAGDGMDNDNNGYVDDIHGWDFVNGDASVYDAGEHFHGTHVAGTIGAEGGNGIGVAGVNWAVSMISAKIFDFVTGGTLQSTVDIAILALDYLTELKQRNGINIVATNNSWGWDQAGYGSRLTAPPSLLHDAIIRGAGQEILFVAGAGNSANDNDLNAFYPASFDTSVGTANLAPASYDAVISVAAINSSGGMSSFSNYGVTTVDIGAPGSDIMSTVTDDDYYAVSGTSMAAPHVTGAVALYASMQSGRIAAAAIRSAILTSATPTASLFGYTVTGGRLNLCAMTHRSSFIDIELAAYQPTQAPIITVVSSASNLDVNSIDTVTVEVHSTTETTPLTVILTETGISTGLFSGSVQLQPGGATPDNLLQVTHNATITAVLPGLNLSDTASVYSVAPSLSEISVNPGPTLAALSFTTSAPSQTVVRFGTSPQALSQTASRSTLLTNHTMGLPGLTPGTIYYYQVTVTDAVANTRTSAVRSFMTTFPRPILFVDDDLGANHEQHFINALNANSLAFDSWNVAAVGGATPPAASLAAYRAVIWNTGDALNSHLNAGAGLSMSEQSAIMRYLDGGGRIFISGQDVLYHGLSGTFEQDYLRISWCDQDITRGLTTPHTSETGVYGHPLSDGMNLTVTTPAGFSSLNIDAIEPLPGASGLLEHRISNPFFPSSPAFSGVSYRGNYAAGGFGVVFTTLPFEAISNTAADPNNQAAFMKLTMWFLLNPSPPPTKFYAVDNGVPDRTFEYAADGTLVENYGLSSSNSSPVGIATVTAGDRLWVVDGTRRVFVYNNSGGLLGSWSAGSLANNATVEGIATDGTNIWIVDAQADRVYYYANAAARLSGSQNANASFALARGNANPKDLVFGAQNGTNFLWVVNDDTLDRVFRYSLNRFGTASGSLSWPIDASNPQPTGITLDPSNGSMDIWISDNNTDRVYRYANGRILTNPTLTSSFPLATGNSNVQGIADPPPLSVEKTLPGYRAENVAAAADGDAPVINRVTSTTVHGSESTSGTATNVRLISSSQGKGSDLRARSRRPVSPVVTAFLRSSMGLQAPPEADVASTTALSANPLQLDVLFSDLRDVGWN